MRLLILFAMVAVAIAQYAEPGADLPYTCVCCGDPTCRTFDRWYNRITDVGKVLISKSDADILDPCKYQVRAVIQDNCENVPKDLFLDWIGVALGVHKNAEKEHRNWIFSQRLDLIVERGQGSNDEPHGLPWSYPEPDPTPSDYSWPTARKPKCRPWEEGTNTYEAFLDGDTIKVRSPTGCCPWALDWRPAVEQTCLWIFINDENAGATEGVCGDNNGDPSNDVTGTFCDTADCFEGDHDGQGFFGCRRI